MLLLLALKAPSSAAASNWASCESLPWDRKKSSFSGKSIDEIEYNSSFVPDPCTSLCGPRSPLRDDRYGVHYGTMAVNDQWPWRLSTDQPSKYVLVQNQRFII